MISEAFAVSKVCVSGLEGPFTTSENRGALASGHPREERKVTKMSRVPVHGANLKANFFLYLCRVELRLGRGSITLSLILSLSFLVYKMGEMIVSGQSAADTMT